MLMKYWIQNMAVESFHRTHPCDSIWNSNMDQATATEHKSVTVSISMFENHQNLSGGCDAVFIFSLSIFWSLLKNFDFVSSLKLHEHVYCVVMPYSSSWPMVYIYGLYYNFELYYSHQTYYFRFVFIFGIRNSKRLCVRFFCFSLVVLFVQHSFTCVVID